MIRVYLESKDKDLTMRDVRDLPLTQFEIQDIIDIMHLPTDAPVAEVKIAEFENMHLPCTLCGRSSKTEILIIFKGGIEVKAEIEE